MQKGQLDMVLTLLKETFGASEEKWRGRLNGLSSQELREFVARIVRASSEEELEQ